MVLIQRHGRMPVRAPKKISLMLDPLKIAFSQNSISFKFTNGTLLSTAITKLVRGSLKLESFPPIRVFYLHNTWFSLDNRRLYVFKEAAKKGVFTQIPVIDTPGNEGQRMEIGNKLTTLNAGRQVVIRGAAARTSKVTKCHYCLKECDTAGHLSLHCQDSHMEEYKEETRATFQTIDQFLTSKEFNINHDIFVSLDRIQTKPQDNSHEGTRVEPFSKRFTSRVPKYDINSFSWSKVLELSDSQNQGDTAGQYINMNVNNKENLHIGPDTTKHRPAVNEIKRTPLSRIKWKEDRTKQSRDTKQPRDTTSHDSYFTNVFCKVLHYVDKSYPLF